MKKKIIKSILTTCSVLFIAAMISTNFLSRATETLTSPSDEFSKYLTLDGVSHGWGFKKNKGAEPDIPENIQEVLKKHNAYYIDYKKPKALYLTFDEGYENGYTGKILDVLKETQTPAAFFVTAPYIEKEGELVTRMLNEGHIVGNHTVNHPNLAKTALPKVREELVGLDNMFFEKYGSHLKYMRPPEGEYSEQVLALANDLGYKTIFWSFAYKDWDINSQKGADYAFQSVTPYLHDGAILLLHAVSKDNADALDQIINYAKEQGYTFQSLDALE